MRTQRKATQMDTEYYWEAQRTKRDLQKHVDASSSDVLIRKRTTDTSEHLDQSLHQWKQG